MVKKVPKWKNSNETFWMIFKQCAYLLKVSRSSFSGFPRFLVILRTKLRNSWKSSSPEPSTSTSLIISLTSLSVGFCPIVLNKAVSSCKGHKRIFSQAKSHMCDIDGHKVLAALPSNHVGRWTPT